jgi:tetratricopeptide (TPR) repeat protein
MKESPQIFAFYSFKGGVGRSMAVLNLAYALAAKGRHVLVLDMDLEAPGLSGFLHRAEEITGFARLDMVDLVSWASSASPPIDPLSFPPLSDYAVLIPREKLEPITRTFSELGRLDIIPVEEERNYYDRLWALDLRSLDQDALVRIGSILRAWLKSLRFPIDVPDYYGPDCERTAPYDYVLVDSRTGITEIGGLCIGPLSDQLVVLSALNDQNVRGTRNFLKEVGVLNDQGAGAESRSKPYLIVASLVPTGELEAKRDRLNKLEETLGKAQVKLSYHPQLALEETIFTRVWPNEYLAREYEELLQQVFRMADDGVDPELLNSISWLPRSSPDFRHGLRRLLRLGTIQPVASLLGQLLSTATFAENRTDADFILWDRVCRVLSGEESPSRLDIFDRWATLLSNWGQISTDPELAALRLEVAGAHCKQILQNDRASPVQYARALLLRGVTYSQRNELEEAITDYTAVISIPHISTDQRAIALYNRGVAHGQLGKPDKAIDDYTAVIEMASVVATQNTNVTSYATVAVGQSFDLTKMFSDLTPAFQWSDPLANVKAYSLVNRGGTDLTPTFRWPDPLANVKAYSLVNRGGICREKGELEKAIADYSTVIQMSGAPADQRVLALHNRGLTYGRRNELDKAIADFSAVIQIPDAPLDQKVMALNNRGATYDRKGEQEKAIADYNAVLQMSDAPLEQKAQALLNRGWHHFVAGRYDNAIEDERRAISLNPDDSRAHGNLAITLLAIGETSDALASYDAALNLANLNSLNEMTKDLHEVMAKHGQLAGAVEAMGRLEARREVLSQPSTNDDDGPAPQEPVGSV